GRILVLLLGFRIGRAVRGEGRGLGLGDQVVGGRAQALLGLGVPGVGLGLFVVRLRRLRGGRRRRVVLRLQGLEADGVGHRLHGHEVVAGVEAVLRRQRRGVGLVGDRPCRAVVLVLVHIGRVGMGRGGVGLVLGGRLRRL